MKRRSLLASTATVAFGFGAGCLGEGTGDSPGEGTPGSEPTDRRTGSPSTSSPTASPSPTAAPSGSPTEGTPNGRPTVQDETVETLETGCLSGGETGIEVTIGETTVDIDGVAQTPTQCYEAVIASAAVRNGELLVRVGFERDGSDVCVECVGALAYAATVDLDTTDGIETVTVKHGEDGDRFSEPGDGAPIGSPTDGPQGTPLDNPASDPDPDLQVSLANEHKESHEIRVEIRRVDGATVYAETHEVDAEAERDVYNLAEASPDGVEPFTIEATMDGKTESMRVETSTCYGDAIISVTDDGELYPYYAIC